MLGLLTWKVFLQCVDQNLGRAPLQDFEKVAIVTTFEQKYHSFLVDFRSIGLTKTKTTALKIHSAGHD